MLFGEQLSTIIRCVLLPACVATACLTAWCDSARGDINWTETYVGSGATDFGEDIEGLASSTLVLTFTTDSGVYFEPANLPDSEIPVATGAGGAVTISGSSIAENNGTFPLLFSNDLAVNGVAAAFPDLAGQATATDELAASFPLHALLPNGRILQFPATIYTSVASPSIGDPVTAADFGTVLQSVRTGPAVLDSLDDSPSLRWSQTHSGDSTLLVTNVIPEPSTLLLFGMTSASAIGFNRRRRGRAQS